MQNVAGAPMQVLQERIDGGKVWRSWSYDDGRWHSYLRWQDDDRRFRALLPGGETTLELPAFRHHEPPRT